jgi:hypothetical protein
MVISSNAKFSRLENYVIGKPLKKSESHWRRFLGNRKAVEEIGKPLKKLESRWRNWKAVEEDFLGFLGNQKAVEENQI